MGNYAIAIPPVSYAREFLDVSNHSNLAGPWRIHWNSARFGWVNKDRKSIA